MIVLLLAAAAAQSVVQAERAFAAAALKDGQWRAFRRFAAPDAVMFVPQQVKALDWLKDRDDPPQSVRWQPRRAWLSCDGIFAVTTGDWQRVGSFGYFTTVWRRQPGGGWRWILDHGDVLATPKRWPAKPTIERASCRRPIARLSNLIVWPEGTTNGHFGSADGTMSVNWAVLPDTARELTVERAEATRPGPFRRGIYMTQVIDDRVAAPAS